MATIPARNWFRIPTVRSLALPALVTVLGLQSLRVYLPSLAWYLRDTVGVGSVTLGTIALATFFVGFLSPLLRRWIRPGGVLWLSAGGLAVLRVLEQLSSTPNLDLVLSLVSVALFLIFLSLFIGQTRAVDGLAGPLRLTNGLILGLALDSLVRGLSDTLDLHWIPSLGALILVLLTSAAVVWLVQLEPKPHRATPSDSTWSQGWPLIVIGPFLLLQGLMLQNQGWIAQLAGLPSPTAFGILMLGNLALAIGAAAAFTRPALLRPLVSVTVAVLLFLLAPYLGTASALYPAALLAAQLLLGWGLAAIALGTRRPARAGLSRTAVPVTVGMIVYLILVFSYYVSFDLALPLPRGSIAPLAAAIFGLTVIGAIGRGRQSTMARFDMTAIVASGALTVIAVVYAFLVPPVPAAQPSPSGTPRVMTYNLHSAFSRQGRLDPEAIARVIEAAHPDVVALQEVSRGWMIDASLDLPAWLSRRLGIPIVFQPTADPVWGNALMSRSGFLYHNSAPLPGLGTRIGRGYLYASIDLGMRGPTLVIATHLHHIDNEPEPRMAQIPVILKFWNNAPRTIIMGDMNSEPTWPEMQLFRDAGMQDAWAQAGEGPGLTWPSDDPVKRIDWIWLSPDLRAVHAETTLSTASDHQGVIADVQLP